MGRGTFTIETGREVFKCGDKGGSWRFLGSVTGTLLKMLSGGKCLFRVDSGKGGIVRDGDQEEIGPGRVIKITKKRW